jgi:hypothetical protein
MKRVVSLGCAIAVVACVPATEERHPAGAAGFKTEPSAAARGEPFLTADGWTLVFDKVVVMATVNVTPLVTKGDQYGQGGGIDPWFWDGRRPVQIYARGLSEGTWLAYPMLTNTYLNRDAFYSDDDEPINLGVSGPGLERFERPPDATLSGGYSGDSQSPSLLVTVRAEKGGRACVIDLTMRSARLTANGSNVKLEVRRDAVALGNLSVEPERLFRDATGQLLFEPFAAVDTDHDGNITVDELARGRVPYAVNEPPEDGLGGLGGLPEPGPSNLKDALVMRSEGILVIRY